MFFSIIVAALQSDSEVLDMPLQTLPLAHLKKKTEVTHSLHKLHANSKTGRRNTRGKGGEREGKGRGRREVQA